MVRSGFHLQFNETEKYDAKPTYKRFLNYRATVAVIGAVVGGVENIDGNTNARFHQGDTLCSFFSGLKANIYMSILPCRQRLFSEEIIRKGETHSRKFFILASNCSSFYK